VRAQTMSGRGRCPPKRGQKMGGRPSNLAMLLVAAAAASAAGTKVPAAGAAVSAPPPQDSANAYAVQLYCRRTRTWPAPPRPSCG